MRHKLTSAGGASGTGIMSYDKRRAGEFPALFIVGPLEKKPNCPLTSDWLKKHWHIHAVEYYSAIKRNQILIHPTL